MAHLKVHNVKAAVGTGHKVDWSTDVKDLKCIKIEAAGRGWASTYVMAFIETTPEQVEVEVLHINRVQGWAMVALKSNASDVTAQVTKRPYKRIDGTSGPQIDLADQFKLKPLRSHYGVQGFAFYDDFPKLTSAKLEAQESMWATSKKWFEENNISFEQFCMDRVVVKLKELVE